MSSRDPAMLPSVVNIGICPDHRLIPDELRGKVVDAIAESKALMADAGYDFVSLAIDPDDKPKALEALESVLAEKHRDAVVIGGGLRKLPEMIPILEEIINTTKDVSPKTQILFADWPTSVLDSIRRLKPREG